MVVFGYVSCVKMMMKGSTSYYEEHVPDDRLCNDVFVSISLELLTERILHAQNLG